MAKVEYQDPVRAVHGKIGKDSEVVYKEHLGTTYTQKYKKSEQPPTAAQIAQREKFKKATEETNKVMQDIDLLEVARKEWKLVINKYKTLRGYVFAREIKKLK